MGLFEPHHLLVILVIALIIFGPGKIGDLGGSLGRGIRDFKKAMADPATPTTPAATEAQPAQLHTQSQPETVIMTEAKIKETA